MRRYVMYFEMNVYLIKTENDGVKIVFFVLFLS